MNDTAFDISFFFLSFIKKETRRSDLRAFGLKVPFARLLFPYPLTHHSKERVTVFNDSTNIQHSFPKCKFFLKYLTNFLCCRIFGLGS